MSDATNEPSTSTPLPTPANDTGEPARALTPQAQRALAEADARRAARAAQAALPAEIGGRGGLDPVRFGDWEKGGIAWDF